MKGLCIVAHPDDHVLWMGGTILRLKDWNWHILSLCNSHNTGFVEQKDTFNKSCSALSADKYSAKALKDYQNEESKEKEQLDKMKEEILSFADNNYYDLIFTHSINLNCEYSYHANHEEARDAVNQLIKGNLLKTKGVLYFCYKSGGCQKPVIADLDNANYKIELDFAEINKKRELKHSFTWAEADLKSLCLWCNDEPKIEAFQTNNLELELPSDFIRIS